jgi:hypothetical protein
VFFSLFVFVLCFVPNVASVWTVHSRLAPSFISNVYYLTSWTTTLTSGAFKQQY